ncbi:MAG: sigma-70 family RNA polymerase sigma factor [Marmoricola sp.]
MSLLEHEHTSNDAELISKVRGGDLEAYGELFARHKQAADRLARTLTTGAEADDLVSDAFNKVLDVLLKGGGPDLAFRAYLLTSVRRLHIDKIRSHQRATPTDDLEAHDKGVHVTDPAVADFEGGAAAKAFASLPERWQMVLWHLEVENQKPAEIAPLLGMSANSVSALAYRAREGLRQAFLNEHAQDAADAACRETQPLLGAYVRKGTVKARHRQGRGPPGRLPQVHGRLSWSLAEVNTSIGAVIAPALLGTAAIAYLATGTSKAVVGIGHRSS